MYSVPDDLLVIDLAAINPELRNLRLRGRIEGRKLVPYYSRAEWTPQESKRSPEALMWIDDPIDLFFMQIQGSGRIKFDDGTTTGAGFAGTNGQPYFGIGGALTFDIGIHPAGTVTNRSREWYDLIQFAATEANKKVLAEANPHLKLYAIDAWQRYRGYRDHVQQRRKRDAN